MNRQIDLTQNDKLHKLIDHLRAGGQVMKPDLDFGAEGCHGLELYGEIFYPKGVGAAFHENTLRWLGDLIIHPEDWMTWEDFKASIPERRAALDKEYGIVT